MLLNCGIGEDSWVSWIARRPNQSILKEINPEYSLEGLMLKLKLQYFGHLMWRADSLEKIPMLGRIDGRERGQQRMKFLDGIADSVDMHFSKLGGQGSLACCSPWGHRVGHDWATEQPPTLGQWPNKYLFKERKDSVVLTILYWLKERNWESRNELLKLIDFQEGHQDASMEKE